MLRYTPSQLLSPIFYPLFLGFYFVHTTAQTALSPDPGTKMAYVTLDESTLYIKGGMRADGSSSNQFYSLDLTKDWDVSNPPWKPLNLGVGSRMPPYGPHHSLVISKDKKSLIYWAIEHGIYVYDIASDSWVSQYPASNATSQWGGLRAVASPYTGLIYVPSGGDSGNTMLEIDLAMNITRGSTMPAKLKGVSNYSIVWCTVRGTFLLFGGEFYHPELAFAHPPNTAFYQYFPITQEWTEIVEYGTILPNPGVNHCLIPAQAGTKMILFGGWTTDGQYMDSIYILDIAILQWTKIADVGVLQRHGGMACAVSGDNFIAWGGDQNGTNIASFGTPLIFNLRTNRWTTQFISLNSALSTPVTTTTDPTPSTGLLGPTNASGHISGAVIGGIIGGSAFIVTVVFALASFIYQRKSFTRRNGNSVDSETQDPKNRRRISRIGKYFSSNRPPRCPALSERSPQAIALHRTVTSYGDNRDDSIVPGRSQTMPRDPQNCPELADLHSSGDMFDASRRLPNNPHSIIPTLLESDSIEYNPNIGTSTSTKGDST